MLGTDAKVVLWAVPRDKFKARGLHRVASKHVKAGATHFDVRFHLQPGEWTYKLRYVNTGRIKSGYTDRRAVTVP